MEYFSKGAMLSPAKYRYLLWREWKNNPSNGTCVFVMLNPSTANGDLDDPTIRKCVGFANRWGYNRLEVVNLFAFRATSPKTLIALNDSDDPYGPDNKDAIEDCLRGSDNFEVPGMIICAWGNDGKHLGQDETVIGWMEGCELHCLGTNSNGTPRHPLYIPYETQPVLFGETT